MAPHVGCTMNKNHIRKGPDKPINECILPCTRAAGCVLYTEFFNALPHRVPCPSRSPGHAKQEAVSRQGRRVVLMSAPTICPVLYSCIRVSAKRNQISFKSNIFLCWHEQQSRFRKISWTAVTAVVSNNYFVFG